MKGSTAADAIAALFILAVVFVLVRPGSLAPRFVAAFGTAMSSIVTYGVRG